MWISPQLCCFVFTKNCTTIGGVNDDPVIDTEFQREENQITEGTNVYQSQIALSRLGFFERLCAEDYSLPESQTAYADYWGTRAPGKEVQNNESRPINEYFIDRITAEYNSHHSTDSEGMLNLQIPRNFFDSHRVTVEVGFWDFPVFLEAIKGDPRTEQSQQTEPIRRNEYNAALLSTPEDTSNNGTQFNLVWTGNEQSTEWNGNWGWEARKTSDTATSTEPPSNNLLASTNADRTNPLANAPQTVDMATEFKVSESLVLKDNEDSIDMNQPQNRSVLNSDILSIFHVQNSNSAQFVLFGMQWCQPVWDGIEDPQEELEIGSCNGTGYIQNPEYANLKMHMVTRFSDLGGSDYNGGKGYGKMEACRRNWPTKFRGSTDEYPGHSGYDLYVPIGEPVFAVRGGDASPRTSGTHYMERIVWDALASGAWNRITYLHLSQEERFDGYAMAGQIIGRGGRSGNLGWTSNWPGHTHLNVGSYPDGPNHYTSKLYETNRAHIDRWNLKVLPTNSHPLLLPCHAQIGSADCTGSFITCDFDNNLYAGSCWAAMELKCPALANRSNAADDTQQIRVVQAQLKFLGYYNGALDDDNGPTTREAIVMYKSNNTAELDVDTPLNHPVNQIEFPDGRERPILEADDVKINGQTRSESFEDAGEYTLNARGDIVTDEATQSISDLLLQWLNLEAPLPSYNDDSIIV